FSRRNPEGGDIDSGERDGINDIRGGVEKEKIEILRSDKHRGCPQIDEFQEQVLCGKGITEMEKESGGCREKAGHQVLRMEKTQDHEVFAEGVAYFRPMPEPFSCPAFHLRYSGSRASILRSAKFAT